MLDNDELIATRKMKGLDDGLYKETSDKNVATEEDIKVIKNIEKLRRIEFKHCVTDREIKAMQNILVELERKDKRIQELNTALLDSIPVQKVKDKIEKIFTVLYENYEDIQDVISEIHIKLKKELLEENSNDK